MLENDYIKIISSDLEAKLASIVNLCDYDRNYNLIEQFKDYADKAIAKAVQFGFDEGHISILPVIPGAIISTLTQLNHIGGANNIKLSKVKNSPITKQPYYLINVDNRTSTLGINPEHCHAHYRENGRFGLNFDEILALNRHSNLQTNYEYGYIALESECIDEANGNFLLSLEINPKTGFPCTNWRRANKSHDKLIVPSYGAKVIFD